MEVCISNASCLGLSSVLRRLLRLSRKEGWDWLAMAALGQRGRSPIYSCIVSIVGVTQETDWPKVNQEGQQQIPFGSLFSQVLAQGLSRGEQSGPVTSLEHLSGWLLYNIISSSPE